MKRNKYFPLILGLLVFLFSGCLKEGDDTLALPLPIGKIPYDVIPEHIQDSLTRQGFVIHEGTTPPKIEGTFVVAPMRLLFASDDYFNPRFRYLYMTFSSQYQRGKTNYCQIQHDTTFLNESQFNQVIGDASLAQVIGSISDSSFTMYCIQTIYPDRPNSEWWCRTASIVSGTITGAGIKNCQYAQYTIDWGVNPDIDLDRFTAPGTYRIWNDGDSIAYRVFNNRSLKN